MNQVEISVRGISTPSWAPRCRRFLKRVMTDLSLQNGEVSVVFCNNDFIHDLNRTYRRKDEATDVLSFPLSIDGATGSRSMMGDIVISLEMLRENAEYFGVSEDEELRRLLIHGLLHLHGLDHEDNSPENEMLVLQERILTGRKGDRLA